MSHLLKQIAQHNAPGPRAAAVPVEDRSIRVVLGGQQAAPSLGRPRASGGDDAAALAPCGRAPPPRQSLHGEPTQTEPEDRRFEPLDPSELPALGAASEEAQALYEAGAEEPLADARAKKKNADDDDEDMDEFSGMKTRQLREAMQRRGVPPGGRRERRDVVDDDERRPRVVARPGLAIIQNPRNVGEARHVFQTDAVQRRVVGVAAKRCSRRRVGLVAQRRRRRRGVVAPPAEHERRRGGVPLGRAARQCEGDA